MEHAAGVWGWLRDLHLPGLNPVLAFFLQPHEGVPPPEPALWAILVAHSPKVPLTSPPPLGQAPPCQPQPVSVTARSSPEPGFLSQREPPSFCHTLQGQAASYPSLLPAHLLLYPGPGDPALGTPLSVLQLQELQAFL